MEETLSGNQMPASGFGAEISPIADSPGVGGEQGWAGEAPDMDSSEPGVEGSGAEEHDTYGDVPFRDDAPWQEEMDKKKAMEAELEELRGFSPVIEHLKSLGFDSADAVTEALAAEEQRLIDANLAQTLEANVRAGRISPAAAQAQYQAAQQQRQMSQAMAALAQYEVDRQMRTAQQQFPDMDEDLVREIGRANFGRPGFDLLSVARRSHERNLSHIERKLASYEAERSEQPAAPLSSGRGSFELTGNAKSALRRSWEDLLGLTKLARL